MITDKYSRCDKKLVIRMLNPVGFIWFGVLWVKPGFLKRLNFVGFVVFTGF